MRKTRYTGQATNRDVAFLVTSCDTESRRWAINAVMAHGGKHNLEIGEVVAH